MKTFNTVLFALTLVVSSAMAQLSIPTYEPSQCLTTAKSAITGATDGQVVGVVAVGIEVPLGGSSLSLAMSSKDGKAAAWVYIVRSASKDTTALVPLVRVLFSCTPPPIPGGTEIGGADIIDGIGTLPLPDKFTQGAALITALKKDAKFTAFNTAFPDSSASLAVLTSAADAVPGLFEIGKFYWILNWSNGGPPDPNSGGFGGLLCVHDIASGRTVCLDSTDFTSVKEYSRDERYAVAPNPSHDVTVLTLPAGLVGQAVDLDLVSVTGQVTPLARRRYVESNAMVMELGAFVPGMYSLIIRSADHSAVVPVSIVR